MKGLLVASALFMVMKSEAQNINHFGLFPTIDHSGRLSEKWSYSLYYFDAFNLVNDKVNGKPDNSGYFIFYAEQAISYQVTKSLSLTGSYVYERQHPVDKDNYRNENRFYFQATLKTPLKKVQLRNRLRFDARFIQDNVTGDRPFTSRIRYLLGVTVPLSQESNRFYFNAYNEMFFNTYQNPVAVYAENWAYAGIGLKTKSAGSWEAGPLYIFWVNNSARDLQNFYYLQLTWITHLDFRKNK